MKGVVLHFAHDKRAVKVYGLLADAGYYATLSYDVNFGFALTVGIKPKNRETIGFDRD